MKRLTLLVAAELAVLVAVVVAAPTATVAAVGVAAVMCGEALGALGVREAQKRGLVRS